MTQIVLEAHNMARANRIGRTLYRAAAWLLTGAAHALKLLLFSCISFLMIPLLAVGFAALFGLGLVAAIGLFWGLASLVAWSVVTDSAEAGRQALLGFGIGGAAFFVITLVWEWVFTATSSTPRRRRRDEDFLG